jgi:hypothetical protein
MRSARGADERAGEFGIVGVDHERVPGLECPHDDVITCPHFQGLLADRLQPSS